MIETLRITAPPVIEESTPDGSGRNDPPEFEQQDDVNDRVDEPGGIEEDD